MRKITFIGTVGVPSCYGGFESLVDNLLDYRHKSFELTVICSKKAYHQYPTTYKDTRLLYVDFNANGISSVIYDIVSLFISRNNDLVLILGVSGCLFLPIFRFIYHGKIITNIDGLEWKRDKWNWFVKCLLRFSEKMAVKYSDIVIGDNKGITDYVKLAYNKDAVLIEYGADHAQPVLKEVFLDKFPFALSSYIITVCRIEPENNISMLIDAYLKSSIDYSFVIVGNWGNSKYGKVLYDKYSKICSNLILLNPIYDQEKINYLRSNAKIYLHGHSAGGTNPSLVEAMNLGLPVLAYDCIYNRETTESKALYWKNADELAVLLSSNLDLNMISMNMKDIANRRYQWKIISQKYFALFD